MTNMKSEMLIALTADIVAAHVSHNQVAVGDMPGVIRTVHQSLQSVGRSSGMDAPALVPAVSAKASVKRDYIACMECGSKHQMLRRHIGAAHGLSPEQYRRTWDLPASYPMTAPGYSERRRQLAIDIGLGKKSQPKGRKRLSIKSR